MGGMGFKLPPLSFVSSEQKESKRLYYHLRSELTGVFVNVVEGDCGGEMQNNLSGVLLCSHVK